MLVVLMVLTDQFRCGFGLLLMFVQLQLGLLLLLLHCTTEDMVFSCYLELVKAKAECG